VDSQFYGSLEVVAYLVVGTLTIAVAAGWLLKRFGPRK
jgi:hypothetical protein